MKKFSEVSPTLPFPAREKELLTWWDQNKIFEKYAAKNKKSTKKFSFFDGPITANNPMGLHHAENRAFKDLWARYKNMQGFQQRFQMGFDCQGLWVEVEQEKDLGFKSKKDILEYGMAKFVESCRQRVFKFSALQTEQSKRLGMFMDWENSYFTMSENNNLHIWAFLKECQKQGLLYKNFSIATWCPRCETGLSQHEQLDGYKDIDDTSVYVLFKLKTKNPLYLLAWTTTPWTLPANVLLAVNLDTKYVTIDISGKTVVLGKEAAERLKFTETKSIDVKTLVGMEYESLFDISAQKGIKHSVVAWDEVSSTDGSGIVHIAPGCGAEDYQLGKKLGADVISPIDPSGNFVEGFDFLSGKSALEVADDVINYLKERDSLYKTETVHHSYPHCWRCKTKALFRLEENWFIKVTALREKLSKMADEIQWKPDFARKRIQEWFRSMEDWMISRKRFYGLVLPFYECQKCKNLTVIGSKEEWKKLAVNPEEIDKLKYLHRPEVDTVQIKCPHCGEVVSRIPDVGDVWLDAGVVPFSTLNYLSDNKNWKEWYPANFIVEMIEQVRLWYYSMLVYAAVFDEKIPYQFVLSVVEVRDDKGERMSKSKGNAPKFDVAADEMGADIIRWIYASQPVTADFLRFGKETAADVVKRFYLILWNSYKYFVTYANQHGFVPSEKSAENTNIMDVWVRAKLNSVIKTVMDSMDVYDALTATKALEELVQDTSTWFIRRSRERFMEGNIDALQTLYDVLKSVALLLAPFVPFVSEEIYQNLRTEKDPESVHLCDYPQYNEKSNNEGLLQEMAIVREVATIGHSLREQLGFKVRQPLRDVVVVGAKLSEKVKNILLDELNVKEVTFERPKNSDEYVSKTVEKLTIMLCKEMTQELKEEGMLRDLVRAIQHSRKQTGLKMEDKARISVVTTNENVKNVVTKYATEIVKRTNLLEVDTVEKEGNDSGVVYVKYNAG